MSMQTAKTLVAFCIITIAIAITAITAILALGNSNHSYGYLINHRNYWYWHPPYAPYYGGMNPWLGAGGGGGGWLIHRPPMVIGLPGMPLGSPVMPQLSQVQGEPSE